MKRFHWLLFFFLPLAGVAQKRPLTFADFDSWKSVQSPLLTPNGEWAAYEKNPQDGDGVLRLHQVATGFQDSVARGQKARFTPDNRFLVFQIASPKDSVQAAKRAKKKAEDMPKESLGIYSLQDKKLSTVPNVESFQMPEKLSGLVAYQTALTAPTKGKKPKGKKLTKESGTPLVIRQLATGEEVIYPFVKSYTVPKNALRVAFASTGDDSLFKAGVYVYDVPAKRLATVLQAPKANFSQLSFSEDGRQLAFVADLDTNAKQLRRNPMLYHWQDGQATARRLADSTQHPAPRGWQVSENAALRFSKDGSKLFFGTAPKPLLKDTTTLEEDLVKVDVWNWQDNPLITQQLANVKTDAKRSYLAVYHLARNQAVQLATLERPQAELVDEGNADYVVAATNRPYSTQHWDWSGQADIYKIATATGQPTLIAARQRIEGRGGASPKGQYIYWYSRGDTAWRAYHVPTGKLMNLTTSKDFSDAAEDDHPDYPNSYGIAGWTANDAALWVYDKYDIWQIDPLKPTSAKNLTNGRAAKRSYRYARNVLNTEERFIDATNPVWLVFTEETGSQQGGYARWQPKTGTLTEMARSAHRYSPRIWQAKEGAAMLFTKENFRTFPDLWLSTSGQVADARQLSDANPQQRGINWGTVETVEWTSLDGVQLRGLLYKPENFDSTRQYPLMTYYYEKNSENLHEYHVPQPARASVNYPFYVSNGYLLFVPDIVYKAGYPGQSAYNAVMPGVMKLLQRPYINPKKLGLQGHSWGGYQTAYLITQTPLFAAAEAGAPVANMTSAYGGIRWESGMSRQAQYETSQSRIGKNLWEMPQQYIENSPLFYAPRVQTPLLMMHNDDDGAVPWYQGIEYFMALKRLNKPVWMLNYNGEKHGLTLRKNRKDWSRRMFQFFEHYLKDAPQPAWMKSGIPAVEKTLNYGWDE